ncbi:putative disease resistance protein RGA4 [Coffea arabica]|uniref:Disease resistance protein RGA1 n=1 Tax=Coffea arabica TaxID=13443 RepID=A0A6P6WX00_COFAR|nr:putative disease resistance protein RGA1 [Coffea arabica]XP_027119941.1 putative disease resistance protein RGA1 [Coffea arabica]XP_027119942.1 putative disease resistance protein RGA1 [Coffea arabica]XP_027119943.1 putative disease resistance protein RGA1 [Coffea arabica]XP_027119944.1 putative disease resistance protein RGA1 [Coffea arabica]XP_027119945.1 putative disease resistance protein RGA1 [Coffea arabica]XP_027119946.1 putative disease resistance protein RGA1 [Coffea arabica]XP_0
MADALLGSTVQVLVQTAIDLASEQIGLFQGFKNDFEKLRKTLTQIQAFLRDAEEKHVTERFVKLWLEMLERVAFDARNLLDDFNYEMNRRRIEIQNQMKRKVCFFFPLSNSIAFRLKMFKKIRQINMDLERIHREALACGLQPRTGARDSSHGGGFKNSRETCSVTVDTSFVGRDNDVSAIVTQLTATSNNETISVLPIVGMGGIGKTTLAQKVFNDPKIKEHFVERMWVCVSDALNVNRLFLLMLESLNEPMLEVESREAWVDRLKELLDGKKYLLVLDDVWDNGLEQWNDFLACLKGTSQATGSWILVTTRDQGVASIMGISSPPWFLEELSDDQCWLIIKENVFGAQEVPNGLQDIGFKIAQKCQGIPLAASVLGNMLRNKGIDEWQALEGGIQSSGGDENIAVTKILKLSFDHLQHPSLKECLAYCSTFPMGFRMERNQLIQLWMAEGFLHSNPRKNMCMEEVGNEYFTILLDSSLFQDVEKDDYGNVLNCQMHDLVYDMVQSISEGKTLRLEETREAIFQDKPFRYLAVESGGEEIPFPLNESFSYITTLILVENKSINIDGWISSLTCLRVLNLASSCVNELPESINKLSHLRYLDSSDTPIKTLPESLCQLNNLQTLRVRDCKSLAKFPKNFKILMNLRHFDFFSNHKSRDLTPLEVSQLRSLQTLPFFNIGEEAGRQIRQLRYLKNLSGSLEIRNLELVRSKEEAESANLIGKPNIDELRLLWNELDNLRDNDNEYNQVLDGLQPHQNLKGLIIERFFGDRLSTWIEKLEKLVKFELRNCKNCKELPTLGRMPFLIYLHLEGLDNITTIGPSFYGESTVHSGSSSQLFPALEHLVLENMLSLREWLEALDHDGTVVVFPVLNTMRIKNCPKIATFPRHLPCLKNLHIEHMNDGSEILTCICNSFETLTSLCIDNVNGLTELPIVLFENNPNLANLKLRDCRDMIQFLDFSSDVGSTQYLVGLESLEELLVCRCQSLKSISIPRAHQHLTALRKLIIFMCNGLTHLSIPQVCESAWDSCSSLSSDTPPPPPPLPLEKLEIWGCPNLISFPMHLSRTPSLSFLDIPYSKKLNDLPKGKLYSLTSLRELGIGPFSKTPELHSFLDLFGALPPSHPYFPSLSKLILYGWPHWESLPEQLQHLSALTVLELDSFGVKLLPDWFGKLSSLERLYLYNCKKLENLPSDQTMRSLTRLTELQIEMCPLLTERRNSESSSSSSTDPISKWSKISHIPKIIINGQRIRG